MLDRALIAYIQSGKDEGKQNIPNKERLVGKEATKEKLNKSSNRGSKGQNRALSKQDTLELNQHNVENVDN